MSNPIPQISHVIFDCDGLILDTESIYTTVTQRVCSQYDREFTWEVKVKQMGKSEQEAAEIVVEELDLPISTHEYIQQCVQLFHTEFPESQLLPGAERLIRHLHSKGVPIAVATGSTELKFNLKVTNHRDLFSLFSHVVFASDDPEVRFGKPAPDVFTVCLSRFQNPPNPSQVLVFEDAPNGVLSAHAAGMPCVWVPDSRCDTSAERDSAVEIMDSLEHFQPQKYGLPPY